ncbi:MAG: hypothetical protein ACD_63C00254G0007 [uncultured bacterium]|nr:MAG: hypothetical protein ACD_63C00254G0007 [uncultured bacterium]
MIVTTYSAKKTVEFAKNFARRLRNGSVICLEGDLGGGKTTFVKGLAKGLGIKEDITSPTFVIFKKFKIKDKNFLYHFDLYRLSDPKEVLNLGFEEILRDKNSIVVIEWADRIRKILPKESIDVKFEFVGENVRRIGISNTKH